MVPIFFVFVDDALGHGFEHFIDNLDMSIGLGVVWGGKIMGEA
jgi:hypothetical protein